MSNFGRNSIHRVVDFCGFTRNNVWEAERRHQCLHTHKNLKDARVTCVLRAARPGPRHNWDTGPSPRTFRLNLAGWPVLCMRGPGQTQVDEMCVGADAANQGTASAFSDADVQGTRSSDASKWGVVLATDVGPLGPKRLSLDNHRSRAQIARGYAIST